MKSCLLASTLIITTSQPDIGKEACWSASRYVCEASLRQFIYIGTLTIQKHQESEADHEAHTLKPETDTDVLQVKHEKQESKKQKKSGVQTVIKVLHCDLIKDDFWKAIFPPLGSG
jgi:hypothetical protein